MTDKGMSEAQAHGVLERDTIWVEFGFDGFRPFSTNQESIEGAWLRIKNLPVTAYAK